MRPHLGNNPWGGKGGHSTDLTICRSGFTVSTVSEVIHCKYTLCGKTALFFCHVNWPWPYQKCSVFLNLIREILNNNFISGLLLKYTLQGISSWEWSLRSHSSSSVPWTEKKQNRYYMAMAISHLTIVMRTWYKESPPAMHMLNLFTRYICQIVLNS